MFARHRRATEDPRLTWDRMIAVVIVLGLAVSALVWPRVYYVEKGAVGDVIWNSTEAYVFIKVYQYGHTFSYLGYVGEVVREIFPFGASQPEKKRNYAIVLHITPEAIQRYSFDNFDVDRKSTRLNSS